MEIREDFLPFSKPWLEQEEFDEVIDTLKSGWITTGPKTKGFEKQLAEYVGAEHVIAVNSATAALHIALAALEIGPGDEVITTPLTFASTANVIVHQGATPVFADVNPDTFNIDPDEIERRITENTKAIMPVHYGGQACEMDRIMEIAKKHNIHVIEDGAHTIASYYKGTHLGTIGDFGCYSFYANKNMTTGEGGALVVKDPELADKCRCLALHGISKDAWKRFSANGSWYYEVMYPGFKYNMTDINAALGMHQLKKVASFNARRREICDQYEAAFADMPEISFSAQIDEIESSRHLFPILVDESMLTIDRNEFIKELGARKVGTSVHYIPLHIQPYYRDRFDLKPEDYPNAYSIYSRLISMPLHPLMNDEDVAYAIEAVKDIVSLHKKASVGV
ncbi:MAG: DegT/DnrJ/EryC1/StrS aminotransferase family protein [Bacteroidota bacterium]